MTRPEHRIAVTGALGFVSTHLLPHLRARNAHVVGIVRPGRDATALERAGGRSYMEEHVGPITSWEEFEAYPWPDPAAASTRSLEWYQENLPDDMCIIGSGGFAHFAEYLTWLMGYETLCYALYDQRDLVRAISERAMEISRVVLRRILEFDRVKFLWSGDDMGFKTATLISPDDLREVGNYVVAMEYGLNRPMSAKFGWI